MYLASKLSPRKLIECFWFVFKSVCFNIFTNFPNKIGGGGGVEKSLIRFNIRYSTSRVKGQFKLTCICTLKGFSDWSVQDYMGGRSIHFRVFCLNGDIVIEHRSSHGPEKNWKVLRLAHIELQDLKPKASQIEFSENDVHGIHSMAGLYSCRLGCSKLYRVNFFWCFAYNDAIVLSAQVGLSSVVFNTLNKAKH